MTSVDAVIVTFNSGLYIEACVAEARRWPRLDRVIVVDNKSTDDSVERARHVADEVIVHDSNVGYGAAQNLGIARSAARYVLMLNPDARVIPEALERGYAKLARRCDVAAVQGVVIRDRDGEAERTCGREPGVADLIAHRWRLRQRFGERSLKLVAPLVGARYFADRVPTECVETPFLAAVAPLVRRAAFDDIGGFDPGYFLYAEDIDLSHRLCHRGWRLLSLPAPWASHVGGASSADASDVRDAAWWRGHRRLVERHWTGARRAIGLALTHPYRTRASA